MGVGLREWVVIRGLGWVLASLLVERSGLWGSWVQRGAAGGCGCGAAKGCWVHRGSCGELGRLHSRQLEPI